MSSSHVVSAYSSKAAGASDGSGLTETITRRSAILKQIRGLQKQEASLSEELAKLAGDPSPAAAQQRIALMQKIQSVEDEIHALQAALLQQDADRKVQVAKDDGQPAKTDRTAESGAVKAVTAPARAAARRAEAQAVAAEAEDEAVPAYAPSEYETLGSLIDIEA